MTQESDFDAGKYMDRAYYAILGHFFAESAINFREKNQKELYDNLFNLYGMIPARATKAYEAEIETLFRMVKEGNSESPMYDLWKIRRLLTTAMDDASMLFNKWVRKQKGNIVV